MEPMRRGPTVFSFSCRPVHQNVVSTLHPFNHQSTSPIACPPAFPLYLQLFARPIIYPKGAHFDFIGHYYFPARTLAFRVKSLVCKELKEDILTDVIWAFEGWILTGYVEESYPEFLT